MATPHLLRRTAISGLTASALTAFALAGGAGATEDPPPPAPPPTPTAVGSVPDPQPLIYPSTCRLVGVSEPQPIATPNGPATDQTFAVAPALPTGLSIDPATGVVTGTPTVAEAGVVRTVTVGGATAELLLTVLDASFSYPAGGIVAGQPIAPIVPTIALAPEAQASVSFTATGLPEGLALDQTTGIITGALPDGAGPAEFTVTMSVTSADGAACGTVVQQIPPPAPPPPPPPPPTTITTAECPTQPKRIYVPTAATRPTPQQMFTNLEHARAAVTKMNALRRWLDAGIVPRRDLCNHTITERDIDPAVPLARASLRPSVSNWSTRAVTGFGYEIDLRGRRPLTESSFAAVEARVRAAETRFVAIRAELMRGVAGADFRERMPASAKLALNLYVPPGTAAPTTPGAPPAAGGPDPAALCSTSGPTLDRLNCHQERAVRMIHLSNVIRQGLLNRIHGEPAQYDLAQSTTERRAVATARLRAGCNKDFPSDLCTKVLGSPTASGDVEIDRWLTGLRNYEIRYLGAAVRHFGVADGSIGSANIVPSSPPAG